MSPIERPGRDVPHLRPVPNEVAEGAASAAAAHEPPRRFVGAVLAAGLLLALIGLGIESHRAARLEGEVAALRTSLAEARSALAAHRQRLAEARDRVTDLRGRVESLDALLASDPSTAAPGTGSVEAPPR